ncbi:MAG: hypothetical protein L3J47_00475 [Sulfurovum sp.]|nr:hypothetical protein [Sulfurovum sp.]
MIHEIGVACTCRVDDVYSSTINDGIGRRREAFCNRCGQDQFLFRNPKLLFGIFTASRFQRNILDTGNYLPGDATFSPHPRGTSCDGSTTKAGTADKLTATWAEPLDEGHVLVRGSGSAAAAEGVITSLADSEDRLWYEPAKSIWCEDEYGTVYTENGDFVLGPGKVIRWTGNQPPVGSKYSIKYEAYFEWIVWQPPGERVKQGEDFGSLLNIRKRHVQLLNSSPFATDENKISLQARVNC